MNLQLEAVGIIDIYSASRESTLFCCTPFFSDFIYHNLLLINLLINNKSDNENLKRE